VTPPPSHTHTEFPFIPSSGASVKGLWRCAICLALHCIIVECQYQWGGGAELVNCAGIEACFILALPCVDMSAPFIHTLFCSVLHVPSVVYFMFPLKGQSMLTSYDMRKRIGKKPPRSELHHLRS